MRKISLFLALLLASLSLFGCSPKAAESEIFVMDTYVSQLQVYGKNRNRAVENVNALLKEAEARLSLYSENSEIAEINKMAGIAPVAVSDDTFELIREAVVYCAESQGRFDITIAPLSLLWGVTSENPVVPETAEIEALLPLVDYRKILLNETEHTVFLQESGMAIDLGGIAKGYLSGMIQKEYEKCSIRSALVSVGGNIFAYGSKPDGKPWTLGLRDPLGATEYNIFGELQVADSTVATSGAYERYFVEDGKIYHHILDSSTGFPAESDLLSVTIVSQNGALADYLSTALYIGGSSAVLENMNDSRFDLIAVGKDNQVYISEGLKDAFTLSEGKYVPYES